MSLVQVAIHASQFPDAVRRDLLESLRTRCVNHKFHYDSVKQTHKWLALHQAFSPSRLDADCALAYERSFAHAVSHLNHRHVHVIGLGCGGGQKDTRLLQMLRAADKTVSYTPCDVSTAMVLVARQTALAALPGMDCHPLVCDLASAEDATAALTRLGPAGAARILTFFGMIPNFEPGIIVPRLSRLQRNGDLLLFSANLSPGLDYAAGMQRILPQYDNPLTRDWLLTFLLDLGVDQGDGRLLFGIEEGPGGNGLKRVVAYFEFTHKRELALDEERFRFDVGERLRLFFSYRYTPALVRDMLAARGLKVLAEWIIGSQEEGVFLVAPL